MTSNQINYFKAKEEARSHRAQEYIGWASHFVDVYNAHTQRTKVGNDYLINLTNAEINAKNAETKAREAEIAHENALINLQNAQTKAIEAETGRINAITNQYNADIRLMELGEVTRHNIESEQLGFMNNQLGYAELNELSRHNVAQESISQSTLLETIAHNNATESVANFEADTKKRTLLWNMELQGKQFDESVRHNKNVENESFRHNRNEETIKGLSVVTKPIGDLLGIASKLALKIG